MGSFGFSFLPVYYLFILCSKSSLVVISPKTECFWSKCLHSTRVMKNWLLLLLGPQLAMLNIPVLWWVSLGLNSSANSEPYMLSPPLPVPVGSPPWRQKFFTSLWNWVLLKYPDSASYIKFSEVKGVKSQWIRKFMDPRFVVIWM